jgi:hypothetical protein
MSSKFKAEAVIGWLIWEITEKISGTQRLLARIRLLFSPLPGIGTERELERPAERRIHAAA